MAAPVSEPLVAIVNLGRARARGESARVASWAAILAAAGARTERIDLLTDHRSLRFDPAVLRGQAAPETVRWSLRSLRRTLDRITPSAVICVTTRAFHRALAAPGRTVVLDYVDQLSANYAQRAELAGGASGVGLRFLAGAHRRVEQAVLDPAVVRTAAGWSDGRALGAIWVPNVVVDEESRSSRAIDADHDLLFVGTLTYGPNVDALAELDAVWSDILRRRPGTTLLVAGGGRPSSQVTAMVARNRWTLVVEFADLATVAARTRLSVAPLRRASGLQNKVLEAAALGRPQIASSAALAGLAPGFPVEVADTRRELIDAVVTLLDDPVRGETLGRAGRAAVDERYRPDVWAGWAAETVLGAG